MATSVRTRLERLRDRTEADSLAEVVRRALAVYDILWEEKEKGNQIVIHGQGDDRDRELILV
jgi:hypothetical protein